MIFLKKRKNKKKINISGTNYIDPLEPIWETIRTDFPIKNYILKEDIPEQLVPQIELIKATMKPGFEFSKVFYSYVTFHQIHFHLKNYIMHLKKKKFGYSSEFLDIFEDIFVDNFIIFRELADNYLNTEYIHYMNIWLDGFFISLINKLVDDNNKPKYNRIQPQLFFAVMLFLALPKISNFFEEVPFTTVLKFKEPTQNNWESAVPLLKEVDFDKLTKRRTYECISEFFNRFMDLNIQYDRDFRRFVFDEDNKIKCLEILNVLIEKTPEIIDNIKKVRSAILNENLVKQ